MHRVINEDSMTDDWLHKLIESAYNAALEPPSVANALELRLRRDLGDARGYIAKSPPVDRTDQRERVAANSGDTETPGL